MEVWPEALNELGDAGRDRQAEVRASRWRRASTSAPEAFLGLLKGTNFGKQLVKLV